MAFIYPAPQILQKFYGGVPTLHAGIEQEKTMDAVYVLGALALWGALALLVRGLQKLEKPPRGRP